jgi:hypothetical protein
MSMEMADVDVSTAPTTALSLGKGPLLTAALSYLSPREPVTFWLFGGPFISD